MLSISEIAIINFGNTSECTFSKIWTSLRAKSKILEMLEVCLDTGSIIKCPF